MDGGIGGMVEGDFGMGGWIGGFGSCSGAAFRGVEMCGYWLGSVIGRDGECTDIWSTIASWLVLHLVAGWVAWGKRLNSPHLGSISGSCAYSALCTYSAGYC